MTYIPLHHKYRPQTFAELVGQEAIAQTLSNALQQQRIAPAYLFTGARGTGKTSSARILAKSLNCLAADQPTAKPCGVCDVCRAITTGSALDVIEIDAASNTGVDNIRELIERAQFAPVQCRYKVYAIDECHMLSTAAFNALLKTLEEPPDRVVFVLATTDPQRVLPTIISRCQRFDFRRIPLDAMVQHLRHIADKEAIAITDEAITLIGQLSQGGLRDAESLLDQLSLLEGEITIDRVWHLVGAVPEQDLLQLLGAIAQDQPETLLDSVRRLMDRGREPMVVLQNLASFYRDLLIAKTAPARGDLVALTPPTWQALCQFAEGLSPTAILAGQQHLRSCETQLKHTTQPRLWLEVALMGLLPSALVAHPVTTTNSAVAAPATVSKPAPIPAAVSKPAPVAAPPVVQKSAPVSAQGSAPPEPIEVEEEATTPAAIAPTEESAAPLVEPPAPSDDLETIWHQVIQAIQPFSTQVMVRQQCHLLGFDGKTAQIGVNSQPLYRMAQSKLPNVETAFQQIFEAPIRISLEVIAGNVKPAPAEPPTARQVASTPTKPVKPTPSPERSPQPRPSSEPPQSPMVDAGAPSPPVGNIPPELLPPQNFATPPENSWQEDEVTSAAKLLADFFAGKVVDLDSDTKATSPSTGAGLEEVVEEASTQSEEDDDDIPF
ncbi:MAG TPA: DNA polymerase III subunit gamma/tau [Leptolyngbyaceae cyanobacterium M33_DOE_097]|uniref:DNA polymerase III subunit gamma/tau n=1 Tax=Oscillatoriales cyanobacterium SpSt-418 TaxID=2282169 RepID=A0A7C3PLB3_9CYAN|nr:DNA polymerase III subunit gamma/tau [Leptolyngbyaceae cyanobacterium M33_DOE_097]